VSEFKNRLGHLIVAAKEALKISRDDRVRNNEPEPMELQDGTMMEEEIIDVDGEDDTQNEATI
jgi:hypothetical protein